MQHITGKQSKELERSIGKIINMLSMQSVLKSAKIKDPRIIRDNLKPQR